MRIVMDYQACFVKYIIAEKIVQFTKANLVYADEFLLEQKTWNANKISDRGIELAKVGYRKIWKL